VNLTADFQMHSPPAADQRLRVLFALPGLHRVVRGAEVAFEAVARELAMLPEIKVTLIGSGDARAGEPYEYRKARCVSRRWFESWPSLPYLRGQYVYEELTFAPGLYLSYCPHEFDVTVTCSYPYTSWMLRRGRKDRSPRHVFVTQNGDWPMTAQNSEFKHFACDGLICTNPLYFARHQARFHAALIPNGVDVNVFQPARENRNHLRRSLGLPADGLLVLMVSALIPSKRVLAGIEAVARIPGASLVIAGDGEQREAVAAAGRKLLGDRFKLTTFPRDRMAAVYQCADVFLHMSQDEPSSNAYLEALATGLPIVTHDWEVTRWTLESFGHLVDTSDLEAVAQSVAQAAIAMTPDKIQCQRELAARRFSWKKIAEEYATFFRGIMVASPARPSPHQGH
jgi:glycosyltransferase involved in cell wall biosynthesis